MRIMWRAWGLGALIALGLVLSNGMASANEGAVVHVKASVTDGAVRLDLQANGPFEYTTYRPSDSLFVVDLSGVSTADPPGVRVVPSDLIKSYRVLAYASGVKPITRLEILLSRGIEPRFERTDSRELSLLVSSDPNAVSPASAVEPPAQPAMVPASAKASEPAVPAAASQAIRQVDLAQEGDATNVNILGSAPLSYHVMHLENPERVVLDFAGAHLKTSVKHIPSNLEPVREIRLAQFTPQVSRVVIDLRQKAHYDIHATGDIVSVSFAPTAPGGTANSAPAEDTAGLVTTKAKSQARPRVPVERAQAKPGEIPVPSSALPSGMTQARSALATPVAKPQQEVAAVRNAVMVSHAAEMAPPAANTPAANIAVAAPPTRTLTPAALPDRAKSAQAQASAASASGQYSGEPISVNLKDVDLRDFFRLIHEISGLNVVVDPNVKGTLTIVLDDVPWDQALDIVLHNNDLDKQLDGNVLRIATKDTVRKEAEESRDLAKAQAEAADIVTTTRVLSYAKATEMAGTLKKFLSPRGDILADARSNTLIIRDIPSTLPVIDNLLRQLDRKSQQVEIEARVVAANRSFARELGTELGISGRIGNSAVAGDNAVGGSPTTFTPAPPVIIGSGGSGTTSGQIPLITALETATPTSGLQYLFASPNFALDYVIDAAESRGVGKLLSNPKVITQNNEKATVKQGTSIPVQTVINNTISVQFVDAVLELDVTPQITADGTVYMDVTVQNNQIDQAIPRVEGIPAIDTQSAETKVTVTDGSTVVIGGIIVSQQQTAISQVPLVGSIPVLGNLFKHTTVSSTSQELLFFLTPRILPM
ncbi:MAG TPA: type IV pilus secretin PilQ [Candidatus Acidoferrales bacterium]|nr:type IV pilus secretin PilQ [Candidatus Acidoferrales bacterium]